MSRTFTVAVKRRDTPHAGTYWERFGVEYEDGMNVTTVLQRIAASPITTDGAHSTPVAYDACCLEEICGACSMLINGRVQQACTALVDNLLADKPDEIALEPMTKFPVVRDLLVDRRKMFDALKKVRAWIHLDDYADRGPGPRMSQEQQEEAYPLSMCMSCGCCVEACPQFNDHSGFIGPAAISQAVLFNENPIGAFDTDKRMAVIAGAGGIADCGNAQNCVEVCPKNIPLTRSLAKAGRAATAFTIKRFFRG